MQLVTLDFETYFDSEYTLSKMTTEEYVRDKRFKTHCCGVRGAKGTGMMHLFNLTPGVFKDVAVLCHHAHFDGLILSHHYGIKPAFWFDTLSMARLVLPHLKSHSLGALAAHFGLAEKIVPYNEFKGKRALPSDVRERLEAGCLHDVELTYEIFKRLLPHVPKEELEVIDLTIRMFTEPELQLDKEKMNAYLEKTVADKAALLQRSGVTDAELASANKFATCLRNLGIEPPTKLSLRTGKETFALAKTDAAFKELVNSPDELVATLCAARLGVKSTLAESRAGRLIGASGRGALPVYLKYYGAHTGRWSGGDKMNWQNFPRGGEIRKSILAPEGQVLVVVDLSQIECRMLNWLAGQEDVLQAFKDGRDIYKEAASRFYGCPVDDVSKTERQIFKSVELGCGYGMGAKKFRDYARQAGSVVDEAEADALIKHYRRTHEMVTRYWRCCDRILEMLAYGCQEAYALGPMQAQGNKIIYPSGGYQIFTGLHKNVDNDWVYTIRGHEAKIYGGLLTENITQALSRVLLSQAMLKISKKYKVVMSTHDECVYLAPEGEAKAAYDFGVKVFTTAPEWCKDIPLAAEGGWDKRYSK